MQTHDFNTAIFTAVNKWNWHLAGELLGNVSKIRFSIVNVCVPLLAIMGSFSYKLTNCLFFLLLFSLKQIFKFLNFIPFFSWCMKQSFQKKLDCWLKLVFCTFHNEISRKYVIFLIFLNSNRTSLHISFEHRAQDRALIGLHFPVKIGLIFSF